MSRHDVAPSQPDIAHPTLTLDAEWAVTVEGTYPAEPIGEHDPEDLPKELVGSYLIG